MSEELFIAKGSAGHQSPLDTALIYHRLELIHTILGDLLKGRAIDVDQLLTLEAPKQHPQVKMVHFNKVLTQINSLLCDAAFAQAKRGSNDSCSV